MRVCLFQARLEPPFLGALDEKHSTNLQISKQVTDERNEERIDHGNDETLALHPVTKNAS